MSTTKWGFAIVAVQTVDGVNHVFGEERKPQFFRQKISKRAKKEASKGRGEESAVSPRAQGDLDRNV